MNDVNKNAEALFPNYARFPITLVKGEGSYVWDDQGNKYLDFISGLAVTNLGHAHPSIVQSLTEQAGQLWHVSNLFHIPNQQKLASHLTKHSCADAVFFCNSGAEANEAAIKLARRYYQRVRNQNRYEIITFEHSFHGRTLATLTATGQAKVQDGFAPLPQGFVYAPYNDAASLEKLIKPHTAAIMLELVQGEGGVHLADPEFVDEVVRLCNKHDLLLIVDEVQTGMGRTGKLFAYEHYGIEPDIFTLAKGLANGFPIGAMLGKGRLSEAFSPGSHGSTFGGTPLASAVGLAVLDTIVSEKLSERAAHLGEQIVQRLQQQLAGNPFVEGIRGKGLIIGIACNGPVLTLIEEAQTQGLLIVTAGPNVIRLLPNLLVSDEEVTQAIDVIGSLLSRKTAASSSI